MVAQEDDFGCGVACVANLLNISYQQALELFANPENAGSKGFWCKDIVAALQKAGINTDHRYIKPKTGIQIYQTRTIVFVARGKKYPAGHYLLRIENGWIDPWINFPLISRIAGIRKRLPGKPIYAVFPVQ
ncbi:MAG: hypothetical protein Q7R60_01475 [bacterium]|nr:hypothetical protein [bacterium]